MALNHVVLFLLGATTAFAQYFHELSASYKMAMMPSGCPPMAERAPLICKLMQHNMELHYKPQLIAPSTYIPPLVVEKCDTPQLQMEIELPMPVEEEAPRFIPDPPALPPITLTKFPVPIMIEEPSVPAAEPCELAFVPEMPVVSIPTAPEVPLRELPSLPQIVEVPELKEPELKPMVNPQPPELTAFVMPELPVVRVPEPPMIVELCPEDQSMDVAPVPEYIEPLVPIPAVPEVPLQESPIVPEVVELPKVNFKPIPQSPELSAFMMPQVPVRVAEAPTMVAPCPEDEAMKIVTVPEYIKPLASIPAAPELSPAVIPELPVRVEVPTQMIIDRPVEEPCITDEIAVPKAKPVFIPAAPRMTQFIMPEPLEIRKPMPIFPVYSEAVIADPCEDEKMAELPSYFVRNAPYVAISKEKAIDGFRFLKNVQRLSQPYMRRV